MQKLNQIKVNQTRRVGDRRSGDEHSTRGRAARAPRCVSQMRRSIRFLAFDRQGERLHTGYQRFEKDFSF